MLNVCLRTRKLHNPDSPLRGVFPQNKLICLRESQEGSLLAFICKCIRSKDDLHCVRVKLCSPLQASSQQAPLKTVTNPPWEDYIPNTWSSKCGCSRLRNQSRGDWWLSKPTALGPHWNISGGEGKRWGVLAVYLLFLMIKYWLILMHTLCGTASFTKCP